MTHCRLLKCSQVPEQSELYLSAQLTLMISAQLKQCSSDESECDDLSTSDHGCNQIQVMKNKIQNSVVPCKPLLWLPANNYSSILALLFVRDCLLSLEDPVVHASSPPTKS